MEDTKQEKASGVLLSAQTLVKGVSVVIPCLNEEKSIGEVLDQARRGILRLGVEGEVIVVDNGSTDQSVPIAAAHGARVLHEPHKGYGAALRRGFDHARFSVLVMGDGDLTYDLGNLDGFVPPILRGEADFVIGNRMRNIKPGSMPWMHRFIGNPFLSLALRVMFHSNSVTDAHCGLRAISTEAYRRLCCVTTGMEFASEMVVCAIRCKLRIAERDIVYHPRIGESKLRTFKDGWRHLRFLMLHSPDTIVLAPGLILCLAGVVMTLPLVLGELRIYKHQFDIHFMIAGGMLNIIGVQVITIGMLAKAYAHLSGLRNDPVVAWFYRFFTFEKAMLFAGFLCLAGLAVMIFITLQWIAGGFGALDKARAFFFAMLCLINGFQVGAAAYLFSIMALPRHIDRLPSYAEDTGISDA